MPKFGLPIFRYAEPVFALYVFALSMHMQALNEYVYYRISKEKGFPYKYTGHQTVCDAGLNSTLKALQQEVQKISSYITIGFSLCNTLPAIVVCLFLGVWSDISGRKIIIGFSLLGSIIEYVVVLVTWFTNCPIYVVFAGSFLNGVGGYYIAMQFAVMAYIADTTEKDKRAVRLGIMQGCSFILSTVSNSVTGLLINAYGFAVPYCIALGCLLITLVYIVFILPESLPDVLRRRDLTVRKSLHTYPKTVWRVLVRARPDRWKISIGVPGTLFMNSIMGIGPVMTFYLLNHPFCWPAINVGYYIGGRFFITGLGMALGLKLLSLCLHDFVIIFLGFVSFITSYTLFAFANNLLLLCLACGALLFSGIPGPVFRGILSKTVDSDEQGALFSAIASLEMIFVFIGSFVFSSAYPFFNNLEFAGATFLICDILLIVPIICTIVYAVRITRENRKHQTGVLKVIDDSEVERLQTPVSDYGSTHSLHNADEKTNNAANTG